MVPTRTTTVLFTDLVASVETASRVGPQAAERLRREHDELLKAAIEQSGGTLVKHLGDGIMATFESASQAVMASISIQQAIHHRNRRPQSGQLSIRIGISGGDVTVENDDYFGAPVAEAARLCEAAQGGQVLASDLVRATTRGMTGVDFRPVGALTLKGFAEPLDVVEVTWETPSGSPTPLPPRLVSDRQFVGRQDELRLLDQAFEQVAAGRGRQVVLIEGEPGMGKSALVSHAVRSWHRDGASIGFGGCDSELSMPYAPVLSAIDHLVRHAPGHLLAEVADRHGAALQHLAPGVARRVTLAAGAPAGDREVERYLGLAAAVDLLATLGEESPVVLVLEDLHWADAATLTFLRHLAANAHDSRTLLIATFRDTDVAEGHPLVDTLASLRRLDDVRRVSLPGLGVSDVSRLIALVAGDAIRGDRTEVAKRLVAETTGNPFYLRELINHLAETGHLEEGAGGFWGQSDPASVPDLPPGIVEVVVSRVGRLGREVSDLLTQGAAIGTEFDLPLLSLAAGRSEEETLGLLGPACTTQLVREVADAPGRYAFAHALVAHSLLQRVGAARRAMLHQKVALALEQVPGTERRLAALAHHWGQAGDSFNPRRARDYARRAADDAVEALAPDDAAVWYQRALHLDSLAPAGDPATRTDLLTRLGIAQLEAGDPDYRETLVQAAQLARKEHDAERLARAVVASNRGMFTDFGRVDWEKVDLLEAALGLLDPSNLRLRSEVLGVLANELTYNKDYPTRRAYADEALDLARQVGDPILLYRVMNLVFHAIWNPDTLEERLAMSTESLALAEQVGDLGLRFWAEHRHYINLTQAGRVQEGDQCLGRQYQLAERIEQPLHRWVARFSNATRLLLSGDHRHAERVAVEALRYGEESAQPEAETFFRLNMMTVFWQSGRPFDMHLGMQMIEEIPGGQAIRGGLALLAADQGALEQASKLLQAATDAKFADLQPDPSYSTGLVSFSEAAIILRHRQAAELLYGFLEPWSGQVGYDGNTCTGPIVHYLGALAALLGRHDEAAARFADALTYARRIGGRFFEARTLVEWARALAERGDPADGPQARDYLQAAKAIAEQDRFPRVAARAAELLRSVD